ncbi:MAG TPA: penicillin-binding transpeptidase domain-containing protein [Paenibacillaceae bacterium]
MKKRSLLLGGFMTLFFVGLLVRVYWVQVVNAEFWAEQARKTWIASDTIPQERGVIRDRMGRVLVDDATAYTVAVGPDMLDKLERDFPSLGITERIVAELHEVLGKPVQDLRKLVAKRNDKGELYQQVEVRNEGWKVDREVYERLSAFREHLRQLTGRKDVGLYFLEERKRYFPNGSLAAHVLGYESKEGRGIGGILQRYYEELEGKPGKIVYQRDGTRTQLPGGEVEVQQAVNGLNITLTIDRDIQYFIEEALKEAYEKYQPVGAAAIAMDPDTGEILGMASLPTFDPNRYWEADPAAFRNNAIQALYEPGSTFKIVTLAGAVEEGLFDPEETYKSGSIRVANYTIRDHNNGAGWGEITYLEGLKRSSNVAFVKLGYEKLGADKLLEYISAFGFGSRTGIELPAEEAGAVTIRKQYATEVATATFGQGRLQVTAIQQLAAVAAIANGGKLMKPYVVKSVTDPQTGETVHTEPVVVRQVISPETSRLVGEYLEQVVSDRQIGTGRNAYIPGYRVAGKTGTAQKVVDGKYAEGKYIVSFIGYAPVEDPRIVLYVVIDEPQDEMAAGGSVAAPVWKRIMEQSLQHLGIFPEQSARDAAAEMSSAAGPVTAEVPDVTGMRVSEAKAVLRAKSFTAEVVGSGSVVARQLPAAGSVLPTSQRVYLLTEGKGSGVPDMRGMPLRDALELCALLDAECAVQGTGYVVDQHAEQADGKWRVSLTLAPEGRDAGAAEPQEGGEGGGDAGSGSGKSVHPPADSPGTGVASLPRRLGIG